MMYYFDEWHLDTNTSRSGNEVAQWMFSRPAWKLRPDFQTAELRGKANNCGGDFFYPGSRANVCGIVRGNEDEFDFGYASLFDDQQPTIGIDLYIYKSWGERKLNTVGITVPIYQLVFDFCKWDPTCDVVFTASDVHVFMRKNGEWFVDGLFFSAQSQVDFLPEKYQVGTIEGTPNT